MPYKSEFVHHILCECPFISRDFYAITTPYFMAYFGAIFFVDMGGGGEVWSCGRFSPCFFLARDLGESGAHLVNYRKYVDHMVLVAVGWRVGPDLRESFLQVREALARAGMVLNPKKTVVVTNGPAARASVNGCLA